jgi:hypothetical protein
VPQGYIYFATDTLVISKSDGVSTWTTVLTAVTSDATLTTTDITTNDVSTSKHGFAPKAPSDATQVLLGTGLFGVPAVLAVDAQTGTSYTLVLADGGKLVTLSNGSAIALTVPTNASVAFAVGTQVILAQIGAGQVTVAGAGGVTVSSRGAALKIAGQYGMATLVKTATDVWLLSGDVTT